MSTKIKLSYMRIIIVAFLLISFQLQGQNLDSLKQQILKTEVQLTHIKTNLDKSHERFKHGSAILLIGALVTGAYLHSLTSVERPLLLYLGAGTTLTGGVMIIDSHKWIGRAGRRRL